MLRTTERRPTEEAVRAELRRKDRDAPAAAPKRRSGGGADPKPRKRSRSSSSAASAPQRAQRERGGGEGEEAGEDEGRAVVLLKLKAVAGPFRGVKFELDPAGATVGRMTIPTPTFAKKLHELHLPDNDVSRKHARLAWKEEAGAYHVRDLNSTNGVKLNGVRIKPYEEATKSLQQTSSYLAL